MIVILIEDFYTLLLTVVNGFGPAVGALYGSTLVPAQYKCVIHMQLLCNNYHVLTG